jgi:hypothetical protein
MSKFQLLELGVLLFVSLCFAGIQIGFLMLGSDEPRFM